MLKRSQGLLIASALCCTTLFAEDKQFELVIDPLKHVSATMTIGQEEACEVKTTNKLTITKCKIPDSRLQIEGSEMQIQLSDRTVSRYQTEAGVFIDEYYIGAGAIGSLSVPVEVEFHARDVVDGNGVLKINDVQVFSLIRK